VHGAGITALVHGRRVAAGTPALLASAAGVSGAEVEAAQAALDKEGGWMGGWRAVVCRRMGTAALLAHCSSVLFLCPACMMPHLS